MIGVLLAGGLGRRLGGRPKAATCVAGRPLAAYPAAALLAVCDRVALVAKPATRLPSIAGVERWDEPAEPRHPLTGIVHALERSGGPVLVCAADMPYVTPDACARVAAAGADARAAVAVAGGVVQPLLALYMPAALPALRAAPPDARLTGTVASLRPVHVTVEAAITRSVNTPDDLAAAESELGGGGGAG